ncbi:hypothetical protein CSKR_105517 [Clonorchis sinensis]|uniref:Uncharacterized protein n=1 Tax=Clonorchis sinensis TaxID=79923 RepID=A0A419PEC2_CLOSI|nr:hypothetical protein CSKR_105517 [Clonorchis sinensis]
MSLNSATPGLDAAKDRTVDNRLFKGLLPPKKLPTQSSASNTTIYRSTPIEAWSGRYNPNKAGNTTERNLRPKRHAYYVKRHPGCGNRKEQWTVGMSYDNGFTWARGCRRNSEENSCGSTVTLGMAVPCHHCTDKLRFPNSPVAIVQVAAIGRGIRISMTAGSGLDEKIDTDGVRLMQSHEKFTISGRTRQVATGTSPTQLQTNNSALLWFPRIKSQAQNHRRWAMHPCH